MQMVLHLNTHRGENEPAITPEEWMPLAGDPPAAPLEHMSEDEFDRIAAAYQ